MLIQPKEKQNARKVLERFKYSQRHMEDNFYSEWEQVLKSYRCERDPEKDDDQNDDPTQTSIGLPDTWAHVRRVVARVTAQPPNVRYRFKDKAVSEQVSRALMYYWDKGRVQRQQKRHATQAALFGWSVRPWYWANEEWPRIHKVDPFDPSPDTIEAISRHYGAPIKTDPQTGAPYIDPAILAELMQRYGKGGKYLPVEAMHKSYEGPKCDPLLIADCFPEPNTFGIQISNWFQVRRLMTFDDLKRLDTAFPGVLETGLNEMLRDYPSGSNTDIIANDSWNFRARMVDAYNRQNMFENSYLYSDTQKWWIHAEHVPGSSPKIRYLGEGDKWLGEVDYPFSLEGKIAFSELTLIDDITSGIGDSTVRILRGLQQLHDRQVNVRWDLINTLLRPLMFTMNRELFENPDLMRRGPGFRLVLSRMPNDTGILGEQGALASAAAGLQDEGGIMRLWQMATGETNMSMMANVDPQQGRTATGAKIQQANSDILTKDMIDQFNETGIKADLEIMFLMARSEMTEPIEFEASQYNRTFSAEQDPHRQEWMTVSPAVWETNGEIVPEIGSTLSDDDDQKVQQSWTIWQSALARPDKFNLDKARDELLISLGKGRELQQWAAPPPPPPPPPPPRSSLGVSAKLELLPPEIQQKLIEEAFPGTQPPPPPQEGGPPGGAPGGPAGPPPPMPQPAQPLPGQVAANPLAQLQALGGPQ